MPKSVSDALKFYPAYCFPASSTFNTWVKLTAKDVHGLNKRKGFEGTLTSPYIALLYDICKHLADGIVGQNIYFYLNHPIKWIRLVGVIVAYEESRFRWIIIIDDSSGATIEVTCPRNPTPVDTGPHAITGDAIGENGSSRGSSTGTTITGNTIDMSGIDLGNVVKVKGGIGEFRGERQITLERIKGLSTTAKFLHLPGVMRDTTDEAKAWAELSQFRKSILSKPWNISFAEETKLKEEADGTAHKAEKQRRKRDRESKEGRKEKKALKEETSKAGKRKKGRTSDKENEAQQYPKQGRE
ncbi:MAG: hypothetical protein Q9187_006044 [Circinaria calcarea]